MATQLLQLLGLSKGISVLLETPEFIIFPKNAHFQA